MESQGQNRSTQAVANSKNEVMAAGFSAEPQLLSGGAIEFPTLLLKKGLRGTISAEVDIDNNGKVERCLIKEGIHPFLDSIIRESMITSVYSPAYEMGRSVPSTVTLQMNFDPDSVIVKNSNSVPELEGTIFDKDAKSPIGGVLVNLQYEDTTSDSELSIGFNRYIEKIGQLPGQKYRKGILSVVTDSSGHFSFRLLPSGTAGISVLAQHYTIAQFREQTQTGYRRAVRYYLEPFKEYTDTSYNITVYGKTTSQSEVVDVEKQQHASGLTHYLSKILLTKATIRQVPEAASAMLIRSGSPYDNRYLIAGVPFLSPYHFGGYPYADMDGMMLSTLNKVDVTIDRIAGRFPDASGALIEASPGVYRPAGTKLKKRPELAVDFSTIGQDLLLSMANRSEDFLQIGYTRGDQYSLKWLKSFNGVPEDVGIGSPTGFGNFTATGELTVKNVQSDLFAWFAYDSYGSRTNPGVTIPWGMASVSLHPPNKENYIITTGGSHQYFVDGKRVGNNSFLKKVYLTNGVISMKLDSLKNEYTHIALKSNVSYQEWNGTVEQRDNFGIDTSISASGKEISCNLQSTISKQIGPLELSTNILLSGVLYENDADLIADGGVSLQWVNDHFETGLNFGRVTSHPDIRGLPDTQYRKEKYHTYLLSSPVSFRNSDYIKIGIQPYMRYQDKSPQIDPLYGTWERALASSVTSLGVDCDLTVQPFKWIEVNGVVNFAQGYRGEDYNSVYEWNIPLTVRGRLHFIFCEKMLHLYIDGITSNGLPYYDFNEKKYLSLPDYSRLDLNLQYRSKMLEHRYLTRYDAYFIVSNILDCYNVRGFYWDNTMRKYPISLNGPMYVEVGIRLGFRL